MAFIDAKPHELLGSVVGNGHCVALVQQGAGAPHTSQWRPGDPVLGNGSVQRGTAIATFQDGRYGNHLDGRSHAAIFIEHTNDGFTVVDQWRGRPTQSRLIRNKGGAGPAVDDASRYAVIETEDGDV